MRVAGVTLVPDGEWLRGMEWFTNLAGGLVVLVMVVAVGAIAVVSVRVGLVRVFPNLGLKEVAPGRVLAVVAAAVVAGSWAGMVSWGMDLPLLLGDFSGSGAPVPNFAPPAFQHPVNGPVAV